MGTWFGKIIRNCLCTKDRMLFLFQVKVYQVLNPNDMYSQSGRLLIHQQRVSAHVRGWLIFNVTKAVKDWKYGGTPNYGECVGPSNHTTI